MPIKPLAALSTMGPETVMHFELDPFHRDVSDTDLIADLRRVASESGTSTLTWGRYSSRGRFSPETVRRRFGSWNEALQRAGLLSTKRWRIPDDELFANLESIWRQLGRQPRRSDLDAIATAVSKSVYEQRFGTWRKALEALLAWANEEERNAPSIPAARAAKRTSRQPSLRLRFCVMRRDRFRCCHCGKSPSPSTTPGLELCVDHVRPWAAGGETVLENLQTLCTDCNQGKGRESEDSD
jgi:5-methylcytosine-specific restriction endonuclease McrA